MAIQRSTIDYSTLCGIVATLLCLLVGILFGPHASLGAFGDFPSFLIVVLGTLALTVGCFSFEEATFFFPTLLRTVIYPVEDPKTAAEVSLKLATIGFRKGIINLDRYTELTTHSVFLDQGITLVVDGMTPEIVANHLHRQIEAMVDRHQRVVSMLRKASEIAPAMGLIGTLIGLVQMLGSLSDTSKIGPAMAVALLTTFYGAILAYVVFFPLASKLERNTYHETLTLRIYATAMESIARKENPRHLEVLLNTLLPSPKRINFFE